MNTITGEKDLVEAIHKGLRSIGGKRTSNSQLSKLSLYAQVCGRPTRAGSLSRPSVELFLKRCLRDFREERPEEAELLARRFIDREGAKEIAEASFASQEQINRSQRNALAQFGQWMWEEEKRSRSDKEATLFNALPPATYGSLIGSSKVEKRLTQLLKGKSNAWVIALTGMGGVGKTAVVDAAIRSLIPNFPYSELFWLRQSGTTKLDKDRLISQLACRFLSAVIPTREQKSALRNALKTRPLLIVLDNLDTELSSVAWVDFLRDLANPSRFVLTSRKQPNPLASSYTIAVEELDASNSRKLIGSQAKRIGLEKAQAELEKNSQLVYQRTGGNPLALKLVVGLMRSRPLETVLESLVTKSSTPITEIYDSIYRQSWLSLTDDAQRLLLAMPLVSELGASIEQLEAVTSLPRGKLLTSIDELFKCSLLELRGTTEQPRYGIHQLTLTFLTEQILKWK